jgi:hypothetical protein
MKNQIEITFEERYDDDIVTTTYCVTTGCSDYLYISSKIDNILNYNDVRISTTIKVNSVVDPSNVQSMIKHLGMSLKRHRPYVILIENSIPEPENYNPNWL